jgi:tetratricopeptide (TPR) repeat protein/predicted Ser/Thr protein kinase
MAGFSLAEWDEVGDVVERALEVPEAERDALLATYCAADDCRLAVARRVLAAAVRARGFLERPAADLAADLVAVEADAPTAAPGVRIGAYCIHELIGRGGMADVYRADRADDEFHRVVAVKVVRAGLGDDLFERFRAERQVLATLDHPHIARLFDGGVTDDGRPFLVMEYVDGRPLDAYADARQLTIDERLALCLQVCDAVDRAHRHLVVHRDLKPGNILVTDEGSVKLLDFGVAKLLDPRASTAASPVTRVGARLMTPEYASPEQFLGHPATTATDVYSAGVVLYELLTGTRPCEDAEALPSALERRVVDAEPELASMACLADTSRGTAAERASRRRSTPEHLSRQLRGDLDNIIATALRREPERRYPSIAALRHDLERRRDGLPVTARASTVRYRTAKFLRRHRVGVAAAALVVAAVVVGTTTTLVQARTAAREGRRAAEIRDFLVSVFEISDPNNARGEAVTARELLDRGSERIDRSLADDPELRGDIRGVVGTLYGRLGLFDRAAPHLEAALSLARAGRAGRLVLVERLTALASVRLEQGASAAAGTLLREALALARAEEGPRGPTVAAVLTDLAAVFRATADFAQAESLSREALGIRRAIGEPAGLVATLNGLGVLLTTAGRPLEAIPALEEALALGRGAYADGHREVVLVGCNLAQARHTAGQLDAALTAFQTCVDQRRHLLGDLHPDVAMSLNNIARVYSDQNAYADAERRYQEALAIQRAAYGDRHRTVAGTLNNLAILDFMRGQYAESAERFRELLPIWRDVLGADHPDTWTTANNLGMALRSAGRLDEAEPILRQVLAARQRLFGPEHPQAAEGMVNLATLLHRQSRFAEARDLAARALPLFETAYPQGHPQIAVTLVHLGRAQLGEGRAGEALASFQRALALRTAQFGETHLQSAQARMERGRALAALGRVAEGRVDIETAVAHLDAGGHAASQTAKDAQAVLAGLPAR